MSEPTLKDVLTAITQIRAEMATKSELAKVSAKVDAYRAETHERLDELRDDVEVIRRLLVPTRQGVSDLRDDVDAIHKGLMKAKPHDVPKELPSQVRAKGERSSKPAKRTARRR